MPRLAQRERQALCDTFLRVGPDQVTLCPPWLTRDLAAHLAMRDRRADAALGMFVKALEEHTQKVQDEYAAQPWEELVDLVRGGPPAWSPVSIGKVDDAVNTAEFFIHHEDVNRAVEPWTEREVSPRLAKALWASLSRLGSMALRGSPVGVVAVADGYGETELHKTDDGESVRLVGAPGELILYVTGRQRVARVELDGPENAVQAFAKTSLGLG